MTYLEQLFNLINPLVQMEKDLTAVDENTASVQAVIRCKSSLKNITYEITQTLNSLEQYKRDLIKKRGMDAKGVQQSEDEMTEKVKNGEQIYQ